MKKTQATVKQFYNKNQFIITTDDAITFQSYNSTIASIRKKDGKLTLFTDYDYSNTTRKHLYLFLDDYIYDLSTDIRKAFTGFYNCKNKRLFLYNLIKNKVIKYKEI